MSVENVDKQQGPGRPAHGAFCRLSPVQMQSATGIDHRQLRRWAREHGLPQNHDGSYSLPAFVRWLRKSDCGRPRGYRRKPGVVERKIAARVRAVLAEELANVGDRE